MIQVVLRLLKQVERDKNRELKPLIQKVLVYGVSQCCRGIIGTILLIKMLWGFLDF